MFSPRIHGAWRHADANFISMVINSLLLKKEEGKNHIRSFLKP